MSILHEVMLKKAKQCSFSIVSRGTTGYTHVGAEALGQRDMNAVLSDLLDKRRQLYFPKAT
jgi:hypothetical protein